MTRSLRSVGALLLAAASLSPALEGASLSAQSVPIESVLGKYEGRYDGGEVRRFEVEGAPPDFLVFRIELTSGTQGRTTLQGRWDAESGEIRFRREDVSSREYSSRLVFDPASETITGQVGSLLGTIGVDVRRDSGNGKTRDLIEDFHEATEEWDEASRISLDDADGDRQWCYVFQRWVSQYHDLVDNPRVNPSRDMLPLLADDRFVPVFDEPYLEHDRLAREHRRFTECRGRYLHSGVKDPGFDIWARALSGAFSSGGSNRVRSDVERMNRAREGYVAALNALRALPATPDGFWTAVDTEWGDVAESGSDDAGEFLGPVDAAVFRQVRDSVLSLSAEPILVSVVDRLLAASAESSDRAALTAPTTIRMSYVDPDAGTASSGVLGDVADGAEDLRRQALDRRRAAAAGRAARRAPSPPSGGSAAGPDPAIPYTDLVELVPEPARTRELGRLRDRRAELEAEALAEFSARLGRLDDAESPFLAGSNWMRELVAEDLADSDAGIELVGRLRARRAADFESARDDIARDLLSAPNGRAVLTRISNTFAVEGDHEIPGAARLVTLAEGRARLLDHVDGWFCASESGGKAVPTTGLGSTPWILLCAGVDDLIQTYMGAMRNDRTAESEMGQFCGSFNGSVGGGVAAAFCEMSGVGEYFKAIFGDIDAGLSAFDVTGCVFDPNLTIVHSWQRSQGGAVLSSGSETIAPGQGGLVCNTRARVALAGGPWVELYSSIFELIQAAGSSYQPSFFFFNDDGLAYYGAGNSTRPIPGGAVGTPASIDFAPLNEALEAGISPAEAELLVQTAIARLLDRRRRSPAALLLARHCAQVEGNLRDCLRAPGGGALAYRLRWLDSDAPLSSLDASDATPTMRDALVRMRSASTSPEDAMLRLLSWLGTPAGPPSVDGLFEGSGGRP